MVTTLGGGREARLCCGFAVFFRIPPSDVLEGQLDYCNLVSDLHCLRGRAGLSAKACECTMGRCHGTRLVSACIRGSIASHSTGCPDGGGPGE